MREQDYRIGHHRAGEVLVDAGDAGVASRVLAGRLAAAPEHHAELGVVRFRLRDGLPAAATVRELGATVSERGRPVRAHPNRVLRAAGHIHVLPAAPPRPAGPPAPPNDRRAGAGVRVAVLDTGIADHPWFDRRHETSGAHDAEDPPKEGTVLPRLVGHGTFVAGVVLQHAPGARILARRVVSEVVHGSHHRDPVPERDTDDLTVAIALTALRGHDVDVVNLSIGAPADDDPGRHEDDAHPQPVYTERAIERLRSEDGTVVVVAAGNDAESRKLLPQASKHVVAVGALDREGNRACFSNRGDWVDVWALGVDVRSTFFGWSKSWRGDLDPEPLLPEGCTGELAGPTEDQEFRGWAAWSGTSFAAPCVAGVVAAHLGRGPRTKARRDRVVETVRALNRGNGPLVTVQELEKALKHLGEGP